MHRAASALVTAMALTSLSGCQLIEVLPLGGVGQPAKEWTCATYEIGGTAVGQATPGTPEQARTIIEHRVNSTGIDGAVVDVAAGMLRVSVPGVIPESDVSREIRTLVATPGVIEFTPVPPACADEILPGSPQPACLDEVEPLFAGSEVAAAGIGQEVTAGEAVVDLKLTATGSRLLDEYAGQVFSLPDPNARLFAIVLDGIVVSAPSINAPRFDGRAQISGGFTLSEAARLTTLLEFGSLPVEIREVSFGACGGPG